MIEAGIFDVGGVLIEWDGKYIADDVKKTLDVSDEDFSAHWGALLPGLDTGKISEAAFWDTFTKATGTTHNLPEVSLFLREFKNHFQPNTDVLTLIGDLTNTNLELAILSNTIESHTSFLREQGIYTSFPITVFSHEVGFAKPDPAIYQLTLEKLKLAPEQTFFVDDRAENIETAKQLGMHGILFENAVQLRQEIRELGVAV